MRATPAVLFGSLAVAAFLAYQTAPMWDNDDADRTVGLLLVCALLMGVATSFVGLTLARRAGEFELGLPATGAQLLRTRIAAMLFAGFCLAWAPTLAFYVWLRSSLPVERPGLRTSPAGAPDQDSEASSGFRSTSR